MTMETHKNRFLGVYEYVISGGSKQVRNDHRLTEPQKFGIQITGRKRGVFHIEMIETYGRFFSCGTLKSHVDLLSCIGSQNWLNSRESSAFL